MKKLITILIAFALALSLANAQQSGPNDDGQTRDGTGPHGPRGNMWIYLTEAVAEIEDEELQAELQAALDTVNDIRAVLAEARADNPDMSVEDFRDLYADQISDLRDAISTLQSWWRETRPDRPDPVVSGAMLQRQEQFRVNTRNITQTRERLRAMDPDDQGYQQERERLRQYLDARKQLLRDRRRGEGAPSGEGGSGRGSGG